MTRTKSRRQVQRSRTNEARVKKIVSLVRKLRTEKLPPKMLKLVRRHAAKLRLIGNPQVSIKRKQRPSPALRGI